MSEIQVTDKAVSEIKRLKALESKPDSSYLRVQIVGGGCSGMSYKLGFDQVTPGDQDKVFEAGGVQLVVDKKSFIYIAGTELDFSDGLNGKGFVFNNPNAKRTCGCGSSFSA